MTEQTVRIGVVGAGANTRTRHIPAFRQIPGVSVVGVVNRTPASTAQAARELEIPVTYPDWQALVADPQIDAVMIGTWPNLHCEVTCAALAAGKHVLCEARMARNLDEAQQMFDAAQAHPDLVAQLVPSPFGLEFNSYFKELIDDQFFGELREVVVIGADDTFWDFSKFLHWRQDAAISGNNILTLGILHETAQRWLPPTTRVMAQVQTHEPRRANPHGEGTAPVTVPDSVQVLTQFANGGRGLYHIGGTNLFGPGKQIQLYGSYGTAKIEFGTETKVWLGRAAQSEMRLLELPPELQSGWRVEAEFIGAIRGQEQVRLTDFATGLSGMEFTEAVHISAETGRAIDLPLSKLA